MVGMVAVGIRCCRVFVVDVSVRSAERILFRAQIALRSTGEQ